MLKMTEAQAAQVLLEKLEDIPEEKWVHKRLQDIQGRCCALGHLGVESNGFSRYSHPDPESEVGRAIECLGYENIYNANDRGASTPFPMSAKEGTLAFLRSKLGK